MQKSIKSWIVCLNFLCLIFTMWLTLLDTMFLVLIRRGAWWNGWIGSKIDTRTYKFQLPWTTQLMVWNKVNFCRGSLRFVMKVRQIEPTFLVPWKRVIFGGSKFVFIYDRANDMYWVGMEWNLTIFNFGELRRMNQFGRKRAHNAFLFNKPILDNNSALDLYSPDSSCFWILDWGWGFRSANLL